MTKLPLYPRKGWHLLGVPGHRYRTARDNEGFLHIVEAHRDRKGAWCTGAVSTNPADTPNWTLHSEKPLHLEPSLLCRSCGNHGFIRAGKWEDVGRAPPAAPVAP